MRTKSFLFVLLCCAAAVSGHDMYVMPGTFFPNSAAKLTVGFHVGDSFPNSEVGGRLDRLKAPRLITKTGSVAITNLRIEGKRDLGDAVVPGTGEIIAAVQTLPNLITLQPAKFTSYLKSEGLTEIIAWRAKNGEAAKPGKERYSKYAKSILLSGASDGFFNQPVGYIIEIIPEADPYTLKAGDMIPIQVLFRGKPAADLQIESAWAGKPGTKTVIAGRTNSEGRLKVALPAAGLWRIHTIKMERCTEPAAADWESFWASLTFQLR